MEKLEAMQMFEEAVLRNEAAWWQMELPSGDVFFGSAKTEMLGYKEEDFKKYQDFTRLLHKDDYERVMRVMRDHLEGKSDVYETIYRIKNSGGEYVTFFDYGKILSREGGKLVLIGFVLKMNNIDNPEEEINSFKVLVEGEEGSLFELFKKIRG
jgi:PAS domain S-box-containing protein